MTYLGLYEKATRLIDNGEITIGEYEEMIKPLKCEICEWIPVGERLPNYREAVLISTFWGVRMAERDAAKEDGTDDFWYLFLDDATAHPRYVYAWMPLPRSYREDSKS